jgi:hypothetical protein
LSARCKNGGTYSDPVCEPGYKYNINNSRRCSFDGQYCDPDETYDSTLKKCVTRSKCQPGWTPYANSCIKIPSGCSDNKNYYYDTTFNVCRAIDNCGLNDAYYHDGEKKCKGGYADNYKPACGGTRQSDCCEGTKRWRLTDINNVNTTDKGRCDYSIKGTNYWGNYNSITDSIIPITTPPRTTSVPTTTPPRTTPRSTTSVPTTTPPRTTPRSTTSVPTTPRSTTPYSLTLSPNSRR